MPGGYLNFECGTCDREFPAGWRARDNHCRSTGHCAPRFECDTCPRWFNSQAACSQHMNDTNHFSYECTICIETWPTKEARSKHEVEDHYYCSDCDRHFDNHNNIKMHLNSRTHRGSQLSCPFCKKSFTAATGVAHHLETGSCPQARGVNRDEIYRLVRSKDPQGLISKKLLEWHGSSQYQADDKAWNGDAYECYFCHRNFSSLHGLNMHLNSPVHQQALYHCPNRACRMDFKTLAAIINHMESESCGFQRFEQVQNKFNNLISGDRRIAF